MLLHIYECNYANGRYKVLVCKDVYSVFGFYLPNRL